MTRYLISILIIAVIVCTAGYFFFSDYWIHRYDELITRQARVYSISEKLIWSMIYEETYFRSWVRGDAGEIGLMQVTPPVAREWARETGLKDLERQATEDVGTFLTDPERNIQIGCWYVEKLREGYRDRPAQTAMTLAAYNAGQSRVDEWIRGGSPETMSESEFISRIAIPSTRTYVTSILERYRRSEAEGKK